MEGSRVAAGQGRNRRAARPDNPGSTAESRSREETGTPVRIPKRTDRDAVALVGGVYEAPLADVDARVGRPGSVGVLEDHDVAGHQCVTLDPAAGRELGHMV